MPSKSSDYSEMLYLGVFWGEDVPFATFVVIRPPDSAESAVGYPENPDRHRFFNIFMVLIDSTSLICYIHKVLSKSVKYLDQGDRFPNSKVQNVNFFLYPGFHAFKIVGLL